MFDFPKVNTLLKSLFINSDPLSGFTASKYPHCNMNFSTKIFPISYVSFVSIGNTSMYFVNLHFGVIVFSHQNFKTGLLLKP